VATGRGLTPFRNFEREMEEFFGRRDAGLGPGHRHGGPVLRADLPGLEQKDVEVSVENNTLTVRGERKAEKETKDEDYYACERRTGAFFRSVTLPPGVDARRCAPRSGTGCWRCTSRRRTRHGPRRSRGHLRGPATTDR